MIILANKKKAQEHLQEIRNPKKDKIRYRVRKQQEHEADRMAKEDLLELQELKNATIKKVY